MVVDCPLEGSWPEKTLPFTNKYAYRKCKTSAKLLSPILSHGDSNKKTKQRKVSRKEEDEQKRVNMESNRHKIKKSRKPNCSSSLPSLWLLISEAARAWSLVLYYYWSLVFDWQSFCQSKDYFAGKKKRKLPFSTAIQNIKNVKIMPKCSPKHLRKGTAKMK